MRIIWTLFSIWALLTLGSQALAEVHDRIPAESGVVSCEVDLPDVGKIQSLGATKIQAHSKASETCFDRRVALYEAKRGPIDMERGQMFIDSCVNIKCQ